MSYEDTERDYFKRMDALRKELAVEKARAQEVGLFLRQIATLASENSIEHEIARGAIHGVAHSAMAALSLVKNDPQNRADGAQRSETT